MIFPVIVLLVILVAVIYLFFIRKYDRFEPEPFLKMALTTIVGGGISVIISLFLYRFFDAGNNAFGAIAVIGPVEELGKLIGLFVAYLFIKKEVNEPMDGLVYIACVSLGFASIENVFYSMGSDIPFILLVQRSILCVVAHITFSCYMGFAFFIHKKVHKNISGLFIAWVISAVGHGLYDAIVFELSSWFLIIGIVSLLIMIQFYLVRYCLSISHFRRFYDEGAFVKTGRTVGTYCTHCRVNVKGKELKYKKVKIVKCTSCNASVMNIKSWEKLYLEFRPGVVWKKYANKRNLDDKEIHYFDKDKEIKYDVRRSVVSSRKDDLAGWLESTHKADVKKMIEKSWFKHLIQQIGFKHYDYFLAK